MEKKNILIFGVLAVGLILIMQLFNLQILKKEYKITAENNAYKYVTRYPVRGLILDRNNNILVGNSFRDVCKVAGDNPKQGTYNAWNRTDPAKFTKGDYMFMTENVTAKSFKVIVDDMDPDNTGLHISDHCPLIAVIGY